MIKYFLPVILLLTGSVYGQVMNTAKTLDTQSVSAAGYISIIDNAGSNVAAFFGEAGYGLMPSFEFKLRVGSNHFNSNWLGAAVEYSLPAAQPAISLSGGLHSNRGEEALDGTVTLSAAPTPELSFFGGIDMDIVFTAENSPTPAWLFAGVEYGLLPRFNLLGEAAFAINDEANTVFSFGGRYLF